MNLVSPGLIATVEVRAMLARRSERSREPGAPTGPDLFDNPSGRVAEVDEVASLVAFVASELAASINGANLRIDGGAADCAAL